LSESLSVAGLESVWLQLGAAGALEQLGIDTVRETGGYHVVDLAVRFGSTPMRLRVAVDGGGMVSGFFALPAKAEAAAAQLLYNAPDYVDTSKFEEVDLKLRAGGYELPAVLTRPMGAAGVPVLVLVHGSGPNDRDESIGPNRPFRDLAWGLATRGIAVLRYDKRTLVAAGSMKGAITVDEEVIADALTALDSARAQPGIDPSRSYVLGHSLGAMLAPEIAARDSMVAGVLVLAGTPRDLAAVMVEQFTYLASLPANAAEAVQTQIATARVQLERLTRNEPKPDELVMGVPASYFYDLSSRDALAFARGLEVPMLFLQGGRDYQVTPTDLALWRSGLEGKSNATFRLYPDLNHLFMTGTGKATPSEYGVEGHVAAEVIEDIAEFIKGGTSETNE
jgi:dienelactone hydrolase